MTVVFPRIPRGAVVTPRLVRVGGDLASPLGGPTQRITRVGSRYAADVELPSLDAKCAADWLRCPLQADTLGDTLSLIVPQMIPGADEVSGVRGSGNAGSAAVTIVGAGVEVGSWFSFISGGRSYLHLVTEVAGTALKVAPLLRRTISSVVLEFAEPKLEGFCDETVWSLEYFRFVGHRFTITESA